MEMLERNTLNRPLNDQHVKRISKQISEGKWRFNGDTIKFSKSKEILDGQHRLWAVIEAKIPIKTAVIYGIEAEAFATIDTLRKPRSGADVLALHGATRYRQYTSAALQWLLRWQRGTIETYQKPSNRIENSDIEMMYRDNPGIERAIERVRNLRGVVSPALIGFFYYVVSNRSPELAERMVFTLENPAGISINDPFFRLRMYFTSESAQRKEAVMTIALMIKATNAAFYNQDMRILKWQSQGVKPEPFPKLEVTSSGTPV